MADAAGEVVAGVLVPGAGAPGGKGDLVGAAEIGGEVGGEFFGQSRVEDA